MRANRAPDTPRRAKAAVAICVAALCLLAIVGAAPLASASRQDDGTTTAAEETTRTELTTFVQNLQGALTAAAQNPETAAAVAPKLQDDLNALKVAEQQLPQLSGPTLDALQGALAQSPSWQQDPVKAEKALSGTPGTPGQSGQGAGSSNAAGSGATASSSGPATPVSGSPIPGFYSDCTVVQNAPVDDEATFYSYWALTDAAAAFQVANSIIPDALDYAPGLIFTGVAYGVAAGIAIGLQYALNNQEDCETAITNAELTTAYPTDASGNVINTSSQASVDNLATVVGGTATTITDIKTIATGTAVTLETAISNIALTQGTEDTIQSLATDLKSRTGALVSSVGTASDTATYSGTTPSGTANGLANTINTREDTILANVATLQTLSVRLQIEQALAAKLQPVVALFELPASKGGYLETVRDVVTSTIANMLAGGQSIGSAQQSLAAGNAALAAGSYATAYQDYSSAYSAAS